MDYVKPSIDDYGSLQDLTAAAASGSKLDASFPAGTPFGDLTFS